MWSAITAPITFTGAGTVAILAARTDFRRHAVVGLHLQVDAACTVKLIDGAVDLTGAIPQSAGGGWVWVPVAWPMYWCVGRVNQALNMTVVGAANGGGILLYREIGEGH